MHRSFNNHVSVGVGVGLGVNINIVFGCYKMLSVCLSVCLLSTHGYDSNTNKNKL